MDTPNDNLPDSSGTVGPADASAVPTTSDALPSQADFAAPAGGLQDPPVMKVEEILAPAPPIMEAVPDTSAAVPPPENLQTASDNMPQDGGPPSIDFPSARMPPAPDASAPDAVAPAAPTNPFIPQGVVPDTQPVTEVVPPAPPPRSNVMRRVLMLVVFLVLLGGIVFGGKTLWGVVSGPKEVIITYWGLWEPDQVVQGVLADFEAKNPKIKVQYIKQSPREYRRRLQAAIARGDGPDVFRFHNTWVPMLKNDLSAALPTVMTPSEFQSTFYPVAANDLVGGETIYGIPLMIDGLGLYYNEDLFAAAGATVPTTWEDIISPAGLVSKLTVKNGKTILGSAIALGTTNNVEHFSDILALMLIQNGANIREPTGTFAEQTLTFYRNFSDPSSPVYTWNDTMDNSIFAFATGKVAMILAPSWRAHDIKQINPNLRFKIAPVPQLPGSTATWASYWVEGVSSKTKNQKEAWELVKYITSRETAVKLYTEASKVRSFGEPYARKELGASVEADPYVGAYITQAPTAKSFPLASRTFDEGINDRLSKYLEDAVNAVNQGSAPSGALQTASAGFRQVLEGIGVSSQAAPAQQ